MVSPTLKRPNTLLRYSGFFLSVGTGRIVGVLIASFTFPILVRRLGVETYGIWSYVVALCAFLDVIANPGLTTYTSQQVAARRHVAAELVPDFIALRLLSSVAAVAALLAVARFELRPDVRSLLHWYGVGALCVGLTASDFLLTSLELFHLRSVLTLMQQTLYAAGVLFLVRSPKDILWLPASILGSALATNIAGWFVLRRNGFRPSLSIAPGRWKGILIPSFHYAAATMMSTIYHRTGHLVVRWFLGDYALGLYAAAVRFVDLLRNFVNIGLGVLMPRMALSAQSRAGFRRLVQAAVSALAAISFPLTLGTLATAHMVVPWLLGPRFAPAIVPVRWMAPYMVAAPVASLLAGTVLYAMGKHRAYLVSSIAGAVTAIVFSLALVRAAGLPGVCVAFILAELAVATAAYLLIPRDLRDIWKNPFIAVAGFSALLMVAAVRVMNHYSFRPVIVVAAGAIVYSMVAAALGRKMLMEQFGATK